MESIVTTIQSSMDNIFTLNIFARNGTAIIMFCKNKPSKKENTKYLFVNTPMEKMECFLLLRLNECISCDTLSTIKAIVCPCLKAESEITSGIIGKSGA